METSRGNRSAQRRVPIGVAALVGLTVVSGIARGADSIDVAALERAARSGSPVLLAARERAREQLALAEAAGVRGDPELDLWVRNVLPGITRTSESPRAVEIEVVQPVRWPGKRDALVAAAAAETAAALAEVALAEQRLVGEVRRTFAGLYAFDREQRILAEAHELLDLLYATASSRFGSAQGDALAVLAAELAQNEHDQTLDVVFSRFQAARARLAELAGIAAESLPLTVGSLPSPVFTVREGPLPFDDRAPSVQVATLRLAAAERRLDAARLGLKPDFGVGGGLLWPEGANPELTLKLGMELPFLRHRRWGPQVAASELAVSAARADLAAAQVAGRAEAVRLGAERDRLERSLSRLAEAIVPRSAAAFEAARIGYINGDVTFAVVLDLFNDWFHARIELAAAEGDRYGVWAESQALSGEALEDLDPESTP